VKRNFTFLLLLSLSISRLDAQYLDLDWVKGQGGPANESGNIITLDAAGNLYTLGTFTGTTDFDPGPGIFNLTTSSVWAGFVSKFDASGNFLWAIKLSSDASGGCRVSEITTDAAGNIYATGEFFENIDLDPGPGTFTVYTLPGKSSAFFVKLNTSGAFIWGKAIGGSGYVTLPKIRIGQNGEHFITGAFSGTADFDPGTPVVNITPMGADDLFFVKLDAAGDFAWVKTIGGGAIEQIRSLDLDAAGNIITCGMFISTVDFDPGPGIFNLTPGATSSSFILKLNASGNFIWVKELKSTGPLTIFSLDADATGSVYLTGDFSGVMDMDPGPGSYVVTSLGFLEVLLIKLDPSGNFSWGKQIGGYPTAISSSVRCSNTGNVYVTGRFHQIFDFDPGPASYPLSSFGSWDIFVLAMDAQGNFIAAKQMGGTSSDIGNSLAVDNAENVYVTGEFTGTSEFNPCLLSNTLTSAGMTDIFTLKLKIKRASVDISSSATTLCEGSPVTFTASTAEAGNSPAFQWQVNGMNVGANSSTYTTSSLMNADVVSVILTSPCLRYVPVISNSITITVTPPAIPSVSIVADKNAVCEGTSISFTATPTNGGSGPSYQWQVNGVNVGTNASNYISNALVNGDNVRVVITGNGGCIAPGSFPSNTIVINTIPKETPSVSIGHFPATICYGTLVTFGATPTHGGNRPSYQWRLNGSPTGNRSQSYITNTLNDGDEVDCIMTSNAGCVTQPSVISNKILVKIDPAVCPIGFYMPTGFTPNGDGNNDLCKPLVFGKVVSYQFALYNRWGQKIFETKDTQKGWDGRIGGTDQDSNIFIWMCSFQFQGQPAENRKGTVTLIR
jgi:gliding motility-associated-like protein